MFHLHDGSCTRIKWKRTIVTAFSICRKDRRTYQTNHCGIEITQEFVIILIMIIFEKIKNTGRPCRKETDSLQEAAIIRIVIIT